MAVNKVEVGGEAVIDLTADTVSENNLLVGATAHNAAGEPIEGAVGVATPDSDGLMSAADKVKLDGISGETTSNLNIAVQETLLGSFTGSGTFELTDSMENYDFVYIAQQTYISGTRFIVPFIIPKALLSSYYESTSTVVFLAYLENKAYFRLTDATNVKSWGGFIDVYGLKLILKSEVAE